MKEFTKKIIASICIMIFWLVGAYFIVKISQPKLVVTTSECPMQPTVVNKEFVSIEGYNCEGRSEGIDGDLLQPSGYWVNKIYSCWKLQTPIKEYRAEQCKKTGDDYWCSIKY